ncbi:hypothetical protein DIPPA_12009 [Diplonema papillatum]|nr:hypothetical protein DIPPA_12009 [Diplonema papillatum]
MIQLNRIMPTAGRRHFSSTRLLQDAFSFSNRIRAREPFTVRWDQLVVEERKQYAAVELQRRGSAVKWYPEVSVTVQLGAENDWIPSDCQHMLREKWPIFYNPRTDRFTVKTNQGNSFEASTEQALDNFLHILYRAQQLATRDGSKYVFDAKYNKFGMPLIFRHTEQKWLDKKRMTRAKERRSGFDEPLGTGAGFKYVGGYQPQEGPGGVGYHHAETLSHDEYRPDVTYRMDPHFIDPELADAKLSKGVGVAWGGT